MIRIIKEISFRTRLSELLRQYRPFLTVGALLPVLVVTFILVQHQQDVRQRASEINNKELYVATNGDDSNLGTLSSPYKTIQKCAQEALPGTICYIRGGTYREKVIPQYSGLSGQPITFKAYNDESVIVSGTEIVTPSWSLDTGSIYKAQAATDLGDGKNQIFIDHKMVNEARWPNMGPGPLNPIFSTFESATNSNPTDVTKNLTTMIDKKLPQIPGGWDGAYITEFGPWGWNGYSEKVTSSSGNTLNLKIITDSINQEQFPSAGDKYFIYGKRALLDSPGEWYLDNATKILYLWHPQSINPSISIVEQKARTYGFDLSNKSFINLDGITLFATSIKTNESSNNIIINRLKASYITHFQIIDTVWNTIDSGILLFGTNNTIKNSEIAYSAGNGIHAIGKGHTIDNNYIHDVDYSGAANAAIRTPSSATIGRAEQLSITNNTMFNAGKSIIEGAIQNSKITNNELYNAGLLTKDLGIIYISGDMEGTEIAYNKIHDNKAAAFGEGIYLEAWNGNDNKNDLIHHNAIWNNWSNIQINRNAGNIQIYNNTLAKDTFGSIFSNGLAGLSGLTNLKIYNNSMDHGFQISGADWTGADRQNNPNGQNSQYIDLANNNYQLVSSSPSINTGRMIPGITDGYFGTAPDIGAFEYGKIPWNAGYRSVDGPYLGTPYKGIIRNIPGTINMEDFDEGGEGIAYHDTEIANVGAPYGGGNYRIPDTGVDLAQAYAGATGALIATQVLETEWLNYTVNVATTGNYTLSVNVLTPGDGATFHVELDGKDVSGAITYNNTGGIFKTISKSGIPLVAGKHIVKLSFDKNGTQWGLGQWDTFSFTLDQAATATPGPTALPSATPRPTAIPIATSTPSPTPTRAPTPTPSPTPTPTPYLGTPLGGVPRNLPGSIRAIDFDNGIDGVSYHDTESTNTGIPYGGAGVRVPDTGVDISNGYSGALNSKIVTQVLETEWLKYTVKVTATKSYTFTANVLTPGDGAIFHVEVDGVNVTGSIVYNNTGSPAVFKTITKTGIPLSAGQHVIKLSFDKNGTQWGLGQWDYFSFN